MTEGIRVENLSIGYRGKTVVSGLSFSMMEEEFWLVAGPNGVGKTTLIKTLLGIIPPVSGRIYIHGIDCTFSCDERRYLSYVPQMENYSKDFPATTIEVIVSGYYPRLRKFEPVPDKVFKIAENWLEEFDLYHVKDYPFSKLSGGQQKKTLIARALISDPHYLFLDEPTTGVDLKSSRKILSLINSLHKEKNFGICMVTHDITSVWEYIDKVILLGYRKFFVGDKEKLLDEELLSSIYEVRVKVLETEAGPVFLVGDKHY
ncbi:iron complex transport system ATP-binding protein/zinc transport system ATP-binding protein [Desulfurobacterium pacificum]|uniref:Iron complex transport system ATP-binding protein/zinc transport system ATP-binding protein n=1 Tax=Desulfurobacterium pacificum TaxID=240166 RepID=A0ABY1NI24_9BACT|nr:ATP-binding cassette domain-containing protein [Desulfurobacterium pacificum]SMP10350.1 iron complex transport system ATP-binding protein/zinc transport system ATP-binding protein [Desulfurobacterium pacificum]